MSGKKDDERTWAADRREFIADERDDVADRRDGVADERELTADSREAQLDQWEQHLSERAGRTAAGPSGNPSAEKRTRGTAERKLADTERVENRRKRARATERRDEANQRRLADAGPTMLALAFAEIAAHLYAADDYDEVLGRIADAAVSTIAGCGMASVTVAHRDGYRTAASTHSAATATDQAQYDADEGPCLDAFGQSVVYAEAFPDQRWPILAVRPTEHGVESTLSYQMTTKRNGNKSAIGSLNSYGLAARSFDDSALEIGLILAAHASSAAQVVDEHSRLEAASRDLRVALISRDVIGQAKGILMERLMVTPEVAFDILRRTSQHLNTKLHEVAQRIAETGELPAKPAPSRHTSD